MRFYKFPSPKLGLSLKLLEDTIKPDLQFPSPKLGLSLKYREGDAYINRLGGFRPLNWGYL